MVDDSSAAHFKPRVDRHAAQGLSRIVQNIRKTTTLSITGDLAIEAKNQRI